jgi:CRP/FNR family nitrogen fixation transcriptional regulator
MAVSSLPSPSGKQHVLRVATNPASAGYVLSLSGGPKTTTGISQPHGWVDFFAYTPSGEIEMLIDANFRTDKAFLNDLTTGTQATAATFYPENAVIYAAGDAAGALYLVEFGVVRICRLTADGRRQISGFLFAGDVFGFEVGDEHQFYAESVNGAGIRVLRSTDAERIAPKLLTLALDSLVRAQQHQLVLGRRSATEKLASFILDMMDRQDGEAIVGLPMQRNDIADYLGLTFETVSRALRVLKEGGTICVPSVSQIKVLDREALENLAA